MSSVEPPLAWALTRGMARVLGINLVDAVTDGWFSRRDLADMVDTCEACDQSRGCTVFLAATPQAETLPSFCANKHAIEALQP